MSGSDVFLDGRIMPIIVACPSCSGQLRIADDLIGRRVRCPACNSTFEANEAPPVPDAPPQARDLPIETESVPPWKHLDLELASEPSHTSMPSEPPVERDSRFGPRGAVEIDASHDETPVRSHSAPAREDRPESTKRKSRRDDDEDNDDRPCPVCGKLIDRDAERCPSCRARFGSAPAVAAFR